MKFFEEFSWVLSLPDKLRYLIILFIGIILIGLVGILIVFLFFKPQPPIVVVEKFSQTLTVEWIQIKHIDKTIKVRLESYIKQEKNSLALFFKYPSDNTINDFQTFELQEEDANKLVSLKQDFPIPEGNKNREICMDMYVTHDNAKETRYASLETISVDGDHEIFEFHEVTKQKSRKPAIYAKVQIAIKKQLPSKD